MGKIRLTVESRMNERTLPLNSSLENLLLADPVEGPYNSRAVEELVSPVAGMPLHIGIHRALYMSNAADACLSDNDFSVSGKTFEEQRWKREAIRMNRQVMWPDITHGKRETKPHKKTKSNMNYKNVQIVDKIGSVHVAVAEKEFHEIIRLIKGDEIILEGKLVAYGKGFSEEEAMAGAHGELTERMESIVLTDNRNFDTYSVGELEKRGERFVHPYMFANCISPVKYQEKLEWVEGSDMKGDKILLPAGCVYFVLFPKEDVFNPFVGETSGLASGTSEEYAFKHALFEIIERDAERMTISLYLREESLPEDVRDVVNDIRGRGCDISMSLGVGCVPPYYIRTAIRSDSAVYTGSCYHPDPEKALRGALAEAVLPYVITGSYKRDGKKRTSFVTGKVDFQAMKPVNEDVVYGFLDKFEIEVYKSVISKNGEGCVVRVISPYLETTMI